MTDVEVSSELAPLYIISVPDDYTDAGLERMLAHFDGVFARRERHLVIVDCTPVTRMPSASTRKLLTDWQKDRAERTREISIASALVVPNKVVRGAVTALNWVIPPPVPQISFGTLLEAYDWAIEAMELDGLAIPAEASRFRGRLMIRA